MSDDGEKWKNAGYMLEVRVDSSSELNGWL